MKKIKDELKKCKDNLDNATKELDKSKTNFEKLKKERDELKDGNLRLQTEYNAALKKAKAEIARLQVLHQSQTENVKTLGNEIERHKSEKQRLLDKERKLQDEKQKVTDDLSSTKSR